MAGSSGVRRVPDNVSSLNWAHLWGRFKEAKIFTYLFGSISICCERRIAIHEHRYCTETLLPPQPGISTPFTLTPSSKVKHMMISNVKGEFTAVTGKLELNDSDITKSRVEASIDAATINTREAQRDAHLKKLIFSTSTNFPS